jgi:glutathione S-transferase
MHQAPYPRRMIEFHAGSGPDTQAIGIALEEMFLDYRLMPGRAPLPVIAIGGARVVGAPNVLMALARKTNRFLPEMDAKAWLDATQPPDLAALDALLSASEFVAGRFSVADMALYPRVAAGSHSSIARWSSALSKRPAVGRGMGVVVPGPRSGR